MKLTSPPSETESLFRISTRKMEETSRRLLPGRLSLTRLRAWLDHGRSGRAIRYICALACV
jgi:hypothetical protein